MTAGNCSSGSNAKSIHSVNIMSPFNEDPLDGNCLSKAKYSFLFALPTARVCAEPKRLPAAFGHAADKSQRRYASSAQPPHRRHESSMADLGGQHPSRSTPWGKPLSAMPQISICGAARRAHSRSTPMGPAPTRHTLAPHYVWCTLALAGSARGAGVDDTCRRCVCPQPSREDIISRKESPMSLNTSLIREQFPSLDRPAVFFDNPGGTQITRQSATRIQQYLLECNANHQGAFPTSRQSDAILDSAHAARLQYRADSEPEPQTAESKDRKLRELAPPNVDAATQTKETPGGRQRLRQSKPVAPFERPAHRPVVRLLGELGGATEEDASPTLQGLLAFPLALEEPRSTATPLH